MTSRALTVVLTIACVAAACTPALDWRDVRPEGAGLLTLFPCKPAAHTRRLVLAGGLTEMTLYACSARGTTYAVGFADVGQPQLVARALAEMLSAAARNIAATGAPAASPLRIEGMLATPQAVRHALSGQLDDGRQVQEQVAVFARGTLVFQATMVGAKLDTDAVETYFGALRLQP